MTPEQLKKMRTSRGMSQREFSRAVGVSQSMLCGYEKGKWPIPPKVDRAIRNVFEPTPAEVYVPLPVPHPQDYGYIEELPRDMHGEPESCNGCRYRSRISSLSICNYLHDVGTPRGCTVESCERYEKGQRRTLKDDWVKGLTIG